MPPWYITNRSANPGTVARAAAKDDALAHHEAHWQAFEQRSVVRLLRRLRRITGGG